MNRARALIVIAFIAGCAHSPDSSRASQTTTTGFTLPGSNNSGSNGVDTFTPESSNPELADPAHPANRLGSATCERKQECDAIGDGKSHATPQACLMAMRRHAHEQLDQLSCENGLDDKAFEQCVKSVRIAECALVDSIAKQDACSKQVLCAH
jgi:hypothetical protein